MRWLSYILPYVIYKKRSAYNRDIRVIHERGVYKLLVNGSRQSGEYIKTLWQHALGEFHIIPSPDIKRILVLGVAGGTVIHLLHAMYPDAVIDGVDIDPEMLEIGKKYFFLDSVTGLTLTLRDAKDYVRESIQKKQAWDMIVVDLYVGASIPAFVGEEQFLHDLKKILSPGGIVLVNYLREFEYEKLSTYVFEKLYKVFRRVQDTEIYCNRFFFCANG
ncbi:hypothetical protein A2363_02785 [Candidatus Gottesmanbacteria bacterium RIFOXYB1_FULL_47_11]|uniref:PABS domain-containing protein n=1 Tax=Candidatus Gottesmanbacteria bacterium RIFOXYB1_FULL_47_11 TaxID=1798401 RepID=A0A1F6BEF5_9BACT|nr:MAG: hypothetical protein A2363_02785 [Candidatus Gottesmanbacteria bacterium RIFOXYB1_FULL_47_11]